MTFEIKPLEEYPLPKIKPVRAKERNKTWVPVEIESLTGRVRIKISRLYHYITKGN